MVVAAALLALLAVLVLAGRQFSVAGAARPAAQKPNFVVIQTDDQTLDQLYATYTPPAASPIPAMPNTLSLLADKGITFNRYYVPYPLCCPRGSAC